MNALLGKKDWSTAEDVAGRYAGLGKEPSATAWQPAANEVAARDYAAEARGAKSLVEEYIEEIHSQPKLRGTQVEQKSRGTEAQPITVSDLVAPSVFVLPDVQQAYFISTQEWDGYVTGVGVDQFEAVIYPVGKTEDFREDAVSVPLWLVDEDARHRVRPGAIFRLATGRQRRKRSVMHGARVYFRLTTDVRKQEGLDKGALEAFFGDGLVGSA